MILNFSKLADILMQENSRLNLNTQVQLSIVHSSVTIKCFLNTAQLEATVMNHVKIYNKEKESLP